jgi:hypothetical protein
VKPSGGKKLLVAELLQRWVDKISKTIFPASSWSGLVTESSVPVPEALFCPAECQTGAGCETPDISAIRYRTQVISTFLFIGK